MLNFTAPIPLSLYIHLPWCVRKCPYCDFNSHVAGPSLPEEAYTARLLQDLEAQLPMIWGRAVVSIFFGGGTPGLFSPLAIDKILNGVQRLLRVGPDIEITLEANPGTIDEARFKGFRAAGVNRLSIGVQSLQDEKLKQLGRIHNRDHALRAIEAAKNAGFTHFNLDLMHGLPNQSVTDALADLEDALVFQPPHLSWYQLTIEPNTFFHHQPPSLPAEETLWEIQEEGKKLLTAAGLQSYEVSAYALPQQECVHNKNYWEFGDYLGIGAGAHSKLTDLEKQIITRQAEVKNPKDYLSKIKNASTKQTILQSRDIVFEFMLNALRLTQGVPMHLFEERTGLPISMLEPMRATAIEQRLMVADDTLLQATELGQRFLNNLVSLFLPKN